MSNIKDEICGGDQFEALAAASQGAAVTGTHLNPVPISCRAADWPYSDHFKDRPYVYVRDHDGEVTKVYRSYADYCD